MAVIQQTIAEAVTAQPVTLTRTPLTGTDTLVYTQGTNQQLVLVNTTATPASVTINGSIPATIDVPGYGGTVSTATPKAITVPANGSILVDLDDIYQYLGGTVTVSGGVSTIIAHLYV